MSTMLRNGWRYWPRNHAPRASASACASTSGRVGAAAAAGADAGRLGLLRSYGTNGSHCARSFATGRTSTDHETAPLMKMPDTPRKDKEVHESQPFLPPSPTETSTSSASGVTPEDPEVQPAEPATLSWRERAKTFAMEYGPVGIGTHAVLSILSFSTIYIGISSGIDVSKLLSAIGLESQAHSAAASSAGSFLMAYTIYKLMSPVRWPLTFAVTPVVMRALRRRGYMLPKAPVTPSRSDSSNE